MLAFVTQLLSSCTFISAPAISGTDEARGHAFAFVGRFHDGK
jgi:hypothetical protein